MTQNASIVSSAPAQQTYSLQRLIWFVAWFMVTIWVNSLFIRGMPPFLAPRLLVTLVFITFAYALFQYILGRYSSLAAKTKDPNASRVPVVRWFARAFASGRRHREQVQ